MQSLFFDKFLSILSLRHMTLVFLLDYLHFSKLLEILPSIWSNFNNLLKRNPAGKQASPGFEKSKCSAVAGVLI